MAYVRTKTIKGNEYLYVQRSERSGGRTRTRHIQYLGKGGRGPSVEARTKQLGTTTDDLDLPDHLSEAEKRRIRKVTSAKRQIFADPERRLQVKASTKNFQRGFDTKKEYFNKTTGEYTPERQKLHNEIINKITDKPRAVAPKGTKPRVILLGGPPGSGKSATLLKSIKNWETEFVTLDSDKIKTGDPKIGMKGIPEYRGYNASRVHEESGDIYDFAEKVAIMNRQNIILDATLKSTDKAKARIAEYRRLGYHTTVYATNVQAEVSIDRATKRFIKKGRYVPIEYIDANADKINKSVRDVATDADEYKVVDTSGGRDVPPRVILEGRSPRPDR